MIFFYGLLLFILILIACSVKAYRIPSGAMEDTINVGDFILVNRYIYGIRVPFSETRILKIRNPQRGDVIVFEYPEDQSKDFIKRVIGTPGDIIEGRNKQVYINGRPYVNPHEAHKETDMVPREQNPRDNFGPVTVPENAYFVMGDNRDRSYDSRFWGFVKNPKIKGLAFIKYWSWDPVNFRVRWVSIGKTIN
jgi:signal peptidase I